MAARSRRRTAVRRTGKLTVAGAVVGAFAVFVLGILTTPAHASTQVFSFGALVFGFALLGWSGSVMAGDAVENLQKYLDTGSEWTEADSRQAMVILGSFGFGVMMGSVPATLVLDAAV